MELDKKQYGLEHSDKILTGDGEATTVQHQQSEVGSLFTPPFLNGGMN